jgi:hypothetical protein
LIGNIWKINSSKEQKYRRSKMPGKYLEENTLYVDKKAADIIADVMIAEDTSPKIRTGFIKSPEETKKIL